MPRVTLRERFFPLHAPADVDQFLGGFPWCAIFKAGTSEKTFDAWLVAQNALEPRADVAVGFIRLPEDRPASDRVSARSGIAHRTPQFVLFHEGSRVRPSGRARDFTRSARAAAARAPARRRRGRGFATKRW